MEKGIRASKYVLRFFFSPGSGFCLWSANAAARYCYGYPVEHGMLNISENLRRKITHIVYWYDTSIDWDCPTDPTPWLPDEIDRFNRAAENLHIEISEALGAEYDVLNEFKPLSSG